MVEAVQQPSAECTAILTLYIVEHPPPPFAVTIYKTCTDQLWSEPIGLEAKLWLLCFCNSMHIVEVYFTGSPSAKFPIWVEFVVCHLIDLIWSLTTLKLIIWNSPNFNFRSYQLCFTVRICLLLLCGLTTSEFPIWVSMPVLQLVKIATFDYNVCDSKKTCLPPLFSIATMVESKVNKYGKFKKLSSLLNLKKTDSQPMSFIPSLLLQIQA